MRRERHLLEGAVGVVGGEERRQRKERREQRAHPDHAGADALEQLRLGAHAERKERSHEDEEGDHEHRLARMAPREPQVARERPGESAREGAGDAALMRPSSARARERARDRGAW